MVANVGDARAVFWCKNNGVAKQLSFDHEPSVEVEREAVEKRGGFGTEPPEPRVKVMLPLNIPLTIPLTRALLVSKPWRNILLVNLVVVELIDMTKQSFLY